jgi:hypothetical protein
MAAAIELPTEFVIHTTLAGREGYAVYRWTNGGQNQDQRIIHVVKPLNHGNLYYTIITDATLPTTYTTSMVKKGQGHIIRPMTWKYTRQVLRNNTATQRRYPVISINAHTFIPQHRVYSFIPVVIDPIGQTADPIPTPVIPKVYSITSIPQHAVRSLLRDAAMQEESCSITGEDIDISNGAVTTCFHLFEKNAIATWLAMPNSHDKCPVCNAKCNIFTA